MTTYRPSRDEFASLRRDHSVVPVWREVLADAVTPVAALTRLEPDLADAFLLESVEGGERWGRYSFLGGDSFATITAANGRVTVEGSPPELPDPSEPPLVYVKRLLESCRAPRLPGLPPLNGGAVGYIGYDCVRELEHLPEPPEDDVSLPDLALLLTRTLVVFDHLTQRAFVITNVPSTAGNDDEAYENAVAGCEKVAQGLGSAIALPVAEPDFDVPVRFDSPVSDEEYARWVDICREHIFAGDAFQIVVSRRFEAELTGSAFQAYRALRVLNPSPYMYYLRFARDSGPIEIAGSSPEPLVRVKEGIVTARPIAGTRGRGTDEQEDIALEQELLSDEKERAEHVMLVDLARNDVGRVSSYGSVRVDDLMTVERYSHVMHIVSSVSGRLAPGMTAFDALTASFPAGTVSGAPKVRAMEIIDSLERTRRGPYAGVVGHFDFSGNLDACIAIRTIVSVGGRAYVQAGAGVVADSVGPSEAEETRRKAAAVLVAAAASSRLGQAGGSSSS